MKTKKILLLAFILSMVIVFTSCKTNKIDVYEKLIPYISNCQTSLYVSQDDNLSISFSSHNKEQLFIADGKVDDIICVNNLLVTPKNSTYLNYAYSFCLIGELGSCDGDLIKTALGISFKAEIDNISELGQIKQVVLTYNDTQTTYDLNYVPAPNVSYKDIITIAYDHFKDKIDLNNFDREIYLKLIKDNEPSSPYYWYISFLKSPQDYYCLVIDLNGKIISEKFSN